MAGITDLRELRPRIIVFGVGGAVAERAPAQLPS